MVNGRDMPCLGVFPQRAGFQFAEKCPAGACLTRIGGRNVYLSTERLLQYINAIGEVMIFDHQAISKAVKGRDLVAHDATGRALA